MTGPSLRKIDKCGRLCLYRVEYWSEGRLCTGWSSSVCVLVGLIRRDADGEFALGIKLWIFESLFHVLCYFEASCFKQLLVTTHKFFQGFIHMNGKRRVK
jgi:hypothetical protein